VQLTAWQDLVRVLTHEIMNSITPVASLARTAVDLVDDASRRVPNEPTVVAELEDARDAVDTVARRSEGLMSFVSSYRQLTRLPDPEKKTIRLDSLFADVSRVAAIDWQEQGLSLLTHVEPEQLEVKADRKMLEQVLINLLKNAGQALVQVHSKALVQAQQRADSLSVTMKGSLNRRGHVIVEVADNGPGIPEDVIDRIFVPFYTTKRDGSGVGLALSRQVMIAHGGTITFANQPGGGAKFTLIF
jgi:signal transduction histidine kinase